MWYKHVIASPMLDPRLLPCMGGMMFAPGRCVQGDGGGWGGRDCSNKQHTRKLEGYFNVISTKFSLNWA